MIAAWAKSRILFRIWDKDTQSLSKEKKKKLTSTACTWSAILTLVLRCQHTWTVVLARWCDWRSIDLDGDDTSSSASSYAESWSGEPTTRTSSEIYEFTNGPRILCISSLKGSNHHNNNNLGFYRAFHLALYNNKTTKLYITTNSWTKEISK